MTKKIMVNGLQFDVTSLDVAPGRALMFEFDASVPVQEIHNALAILEQAFAGLDYNVPIFLFREGYCVARNLTDEQMLEYGWIAVKEPSTPKKNNVVSLVRKEK